MFNSYSVKLKVYYLLPYLLSYQIQRESHEQGRDWDNSGFKQPWDNARLPSSIASTNTLDWRRPRQHGDNWIPSQSRSTFLRIWESTSGLRS